MESVGEVIASELASAESASPNVATNTEDVATSASEGQRSEAPGRPFDSETAREAARKSAASRRAAADRRKEEAETASLVNEMTVTGRVATALAKQLSLAELETVIAAQRTKAQAGSKDGSSELRAWIKLLASMPAEDEVPEGAEWANLTPSQRAEYRKVFMEQAAQLRALPEAGEVEAEATPTPGPSHPPE